MKSLIQAFPQQLSEALSIGKGAELRPAKNEIRNVLITGLGGSGIGGSIVAELLSEYCPVPVTVNKNYEIPGFVDSSTLVIVSSYSGNTEETLAALATAEEEGAEIAIITSGGTALAKAQEKGYNHIVVPGGNPPRSMLAYSLVQQFVLFSHYQLTNIPFVDQVEKFIADLDQEAMVSETLELAKELQNTLPIIYSVDGNEGVAVRFRQQLNENSKMLCWHAVVPEMNHNELVGWKAGKEDMSVVYFRNTTDFDRNQKRIEINKEIIANYTNRIHEVWSKGESKLERALYHIHFGDWVSLHLSDLNEVDVMEIEVIDHLKSELSKF
ncbi:MAG: bifunctional phosphoglucose/phosphomannose isomerase [Crocinitomicaceae bacterium]|nr:bifunctional phosphoglucose/phosphomannose isomerase [Crocinitomicaceae bacterium]|tara:strand:- start:687 stop:1664 length:978 start_codon:yes stop_codon:yes gene_type:complete